MNVENRTKIANFPTPVYLTPPMKGLRLEFGIGVRGPECFYDGAIRWSKKFSDTFSRFDTIPAVTDSHPASHVAVAITLNAKASSLIITKVALLFQKKTYFADYHSHRGMHSVKGVFKLVIPPDRNVAVRSAA